MNVGILASHMRLHRKDIYCIAPSTINTCGAINVVSFGFHSALIVNNEFKVVFAYILFAIHRFVSTRREL